MTIEEEIIACPECGSNCRDYDGMNGDVEGRRDRYRKNVVVEELLPEEFLLQVEQIDIVEAVPVAVKVAAKIGQGRPEEVCIVVGHVAAGLVGGEFRQRVQGVKWLALVFDEGKVQIPERTRILSHGAHHVHVTLEIRFIEADEEAVCHQINPS